jgi:hypothetical protein
VSTSPVYQGLDQRYGGDSPKPSWVGISLSGVRNQCWDCWPLSTKEKPWCGFPRQIVAGSNAAGILHVGGVMSISLTKSGPKPLKLTLKGNSQGYRRL